MFLNQDERLVARPKIALVRDFLGAVEHNPFLFYSSREELLEKMEEFSSDVKSAAKKLSELTEVALSGFEEDGSTAEKYLASGLIAMSHNNGEAIDLTLSNMFMNYCKIPYFTLREMEQAEKAGFDRCPKKAETAMVGLASLHLLAKAIPVVYEELSRMPDMAPAVR